MKKSLVLLAILFTCISMLTAGDYIIGTGTTTQNMVPFYGWVNFNWSRFFYSASEMAASGFTESQPITKLAFFVGNNVSNYVTDDQRIYIRYFYDAEYASNNVNYPGTASFTHVFTGSVTWDGPGWVEIELDNQFNYIAGWGIEILWENRDGSRTAGPPSFRYTETSNFTAVQHSGSATSFPTTNGTRRRDRRPNIWFMTPPTGPPNPVSAVTPADGSTGININNILRWQHNGGQPTSYRLWFGTNNPPTNIVNAMLTTESSFTPPQYLQYNTQYFWRVVPLNDFGPNLEATTFSFTTMPDPSIVNFPHLESFDGGFPPTGWTHHSGTLVDPIVMGGVNSSVWGQANWLNIPSTDKAARINIWGSISGYLISPLFNVPSDDYVLSFDAAILRYNQTPDGNPPNYNNPDDRFAILIGDGFTWTTANIVREYNNAGSDYVLNDIPVHGQRISIPLTGHSGHIRVAIFAGSTDFNDDNDVMVNNFRIGLPEQQVDAPTVNFIRDNATGQPVLSWETVSGATTYRIYKATNPFGDYQLLDSISGTQYFPAEADSKAFFKITAE